MNKQAWVVIGCCAMAVTAGAMGRKPEREPERPGFVGALSVSLKNGQAAISFETDRWCDATVAIEDTEGRRIRHLAAGMLGDNAPPPLQQKSRRQLLVWDGKDDSGQLVDMSGCRVTVTLGLRHRFDRAMGHSHYTIGEVKALTVDAQGDLLVLEGYSVPSLKRFSRKGEYRRTLLPHDPGLPAKQRAGVRTWTRLDGKEVPYLVNMRDPYDALSATGLYGLMRSGPMAVVNGRILLAGPGGNRVVVLGADGSIPSSMRGPRVVGESDGGVFGMVANAEGTALYASGKSGVYRLALNEKDATPERFVATGAELGKPRGLALDAQNRLIVCDSQKGRIARFDAQGALADTLAVPRPLQTAVSRRNGALYVLAMQKNHFPQLIKFAGFREERVWTLDLPRVPGNTPPIFALDDSADPVVLWIGQPQQMDWCEQVLVRVEDLGDRPGEPRELSDKATVGMMSPVHLAADRARDEVYAREWRLGGHRGQWFARFDGEGNRSNSGIRANEVAVGYDGRIYARSFHGGEAGTWIARFDRDGTEIPFANAKNHEAAPDHPGLWILGSLHGATAIGMRGFDVAPNGDLYIMRYFSARGGKGPWVRRGFQFPDFPEEHVSYTTPLVDVYGPEGALKTPNLIGYFVGRSAFGARVARDGSVYVADHLKPPGVYYHPEAAPHMPAVEAPDDPRRRMWHPDSIPGTRGWNWPLFNTGTIFKFPPQGGRIAPTNADDPQAMFSGTDVRRERRYARVEGALWSHTGLSPAPADVKGGRESATCVCTNSRFDLDPFGRVYVPDVYRFSVDVLDANGNALTRFGEYGNADTQGPGIHLNWGAFVACTPDAVYVADNLNRRIVRVVAEHAATASAAVPTRERAARSK